MTANGHRRPCRWCGFKLGGIPEGSRRDREACSSACKKALQRRRRRQLTVDQAIAEAVPSTTAATGEPTP